MILSTNRVKHRVFITLFSFIAVIGVLTSCEKQEGFGGTGSITGTITEDFFNDDYSDRLYQMPSVDEEVFILFGEDGSLGDRELTGISGKFSFDYLYPGRYYIYFRSQDSTEIPDDGWSERIAVDLENGETEDLGMLIKVNTLDFDDGEAAIRGVVEKIKYDKDSSWPNLVVEYVDFAHEHEVYLTYGNHVSYDERVRTSHDGSFEFRDLIPGNYKVFLYSEDVTKVTEHEVLLFEVSIEEPDQVEDLGVITIKEK